MLNEAFALPRPAAGEKSVGSVTGPSGSALVVVTRVLAGDVAATSETFVDQLSKEVVARDHQLSLPRFSTQPGRFVMSRSKN